MLDSTHCYKLTEIAAKANDFLIERGCPEFSITGVNWDDDEGQWVVSYYSDYGNEYTNVWVQEAPNGYRLAGHSFEKPEIKFS